MPKPNFLEPKKSPSAFAYKKNFQKFATESPNFLYLDDCGRSGCSRLCQHAELSSAELDSNFGRPPSSATWGTPTTWFVSRLTKPETTSKLQVKLIHYLVHLHQLKIPPLDGGRVLPENMPHLPMRQIRQVKTTSHSDT
ncbi:uncharacterized protein LOC126609769 [Malus sylvestris]|uniref:uncharacterized protein LOC126609769 n=1 Tax=Malus sylvestris TaxID=3752 RepID=UPI0021AD12AD|nr:uncharacterized protein LOC126609769 [Malus sylvestris]